ncbi:MAG: hypothetical protein A2275_06520 [Bacteroidetes bacterium RIFOXYA12_FULL_35_11]|nr:MAG: hypothetical protein A2X01_17730 [Bacteroidetes bacterium GWF2_35_48]OFY72714.1 MAG: hypothetical protein A2275_06520 [Bacteroidetes bacterium RIFOXYA12_FULL_35_11]OFY95774.1 MAG: hypothetical protein A2491_09600 [Bacteroidetes bacterium RIFOXYC12_FULL_35_7]HBX53582.1 hypothetical protein [Bacteroidales bacterium]
MKYVITIIVVFAISCTSKKGVFYSEMNKTVVVKYEKNKLVLYTGNSKDHSAYLIYDVTAKADKSKKELHISAWQAPKKENKDRFEIDIQKLGISDIQDYKIIWLDPDGKSTNLQLEKNQ